MLNSVGNINIREMVSLKQYLLLCKKYCFNIIAFALLLGLVGCLCSQTIFRPKYTARTQIIVQTKNNSESNNQSNTDPITTYKDLITSQKVLLFLSNKFNRQIGVGELSHAISIDNTQGSQFMTINVSLNSAKNSYLIANSLTNYVSNNSNRLMKNTNVKVVSYATFPKNSTLYSPTFQFVAGTIIGLIIGLLFILVRSYFRPTIFDDQFITNELKQPFLGSISFDRKIGARK